jgi:uncharacterized membrane protein YeaQ/YmgE (transglycosylase-associated protein family)
MLVGVLVGMLARLVMARRPSTGPVLLILLGIAGAMLAGFLGHALDAFDPREPLSFAAAAAGAALIIGLYRLLLGARRSA